MKRLLIVAIALFVVVKLVRVIRREIEDRDIGRELAGTMERQAGYERSLMRYTNRFRLGMTREQVENALRADNTKFTSRNKSSEDLIYLGGEYISHINGHRFCAFKFIYVAFQFAPQDQDHEVPQTVLKNIWLDHEIRGCL